MLSKGFRSLVYILVFTCQFFSCYGIRQDAVTKGQTARMYCFDPSYKSYEHYFIRIFYNGEQIGFINYDKTTGFSLKDYQISQNQLGRYRVEQTGHLELTKVEYTDRGEYKCKMEAFLLDNNLFTTTDLLVYVPPAVIIEGPKGNYLDSGTEVVKAAECHAENGSPKAEVTWSTDRHLDFDQELGESSEGDFFTVTSALMVVPTKYYHNQVFICTVTHPSFQTPKQEAFTLNVTYPPEVPVVEVNKNYTRLICSADANPPPKYEWVLPNGKTIHGNTTAIIAPTNSENDDDQYTCTATNNRGSSERTIKRSEAMVQRASISKSSTGMIIGVVFGIIFLLALIMGLVYVFLLKPSRSKDPGPYLPTARDSVRPMIEHPHGGRPPSPRLPPPLMTKNELDDATSSDEGDAGSSYSDEEGRHDVDIEVNPYTTVVDPAPVDGAPLKPGITSRASLNFQPYWIYPEARRQRPIASPSYRNSTHQHQQQPNDVAPPPRRSASRSTIENNRPFSYGMPPRPNDNDGLPPYEGHYSEIDHGNYKPGPVRRTEEQVEYAQIRKYSDSHVV